MAEELPDWMQEFPETYSDASAGKEKKAPKKRAKSEAKPSSKKSPVTRTQAAILAGLLLMLCFICAGIIGVGYANRQALFGPAPQAVAATPAPQVTPTQPPAETPPSPTPTPTPTVTPSPRPTLALPEPAATIAPSPTATYAVAPDFVNKDKIAAITAFVEEQRGLSLPEPVPINFLTYQQLRDKWQTESFDSATIEAIRTQQEFYRALGLIAPEVDLVQASFETQTDILLGYYAPDEKVMYIIAESVNMFAEEEMTFAHEYVHALQDHYFDLAPLLAADASADTLLARRSLLEGDARLVEDLFTLENVGQDQLDYSVYRYLFQEHPQPEGISPALSIFTFFPYTAGEYFVIYLLIEGDYSWELVNQAYANPPISSEQVMHPEKYLAGEAPVPIPLPDLGPVLGDGWREIDRDVLGEIGLLAWLIDQVDEQAASQAAAGWDGDAYTLWLDEAGRRLLVESSLWESETDAADFFNTFRSYMNSREIGGIQYEEAGTYFWEHEGGLTFAGRQGKQVLIIVAPDRASLDEVRAQFTGF